MKKLSFIIALLLIFNHSFSQSKKEIAISILNNNKKISLLTMNDKSPYSLYPDSLFFIDSINEMTSKIPNVWKSNESDFSSNIDEINFGGKILIENLKQGDVFMVLEVNVTRHHTYSYDNMTKSNISTPTNMHNVDKTLSMFYINKRGKRKLLFSSANSFMLSDSTRVNFIERKDALKAAYSSSFFSDLDLEVLIKSLKDKVFVSAYPNNKKEIKIKREEEKEEKIDDFLESSDEEKKKLIKEKMNHDMTDEEMKMLEEYLNSGAKKKKKK